MTLVRGYAVSDASLAMTFEFSRLPFSVLIGYLAFGELIDAWTWAGALIIFAAAAFVTRREAQLARRRREALTAAPADLLAESAATLCRAPMSLLRCSAGSRKAVASLSPAGL